MPSGDDVTVPEPVPFLNTTNVRGTTTNVAVTDLAASMVKIRGADWNLTAGSPIAIPVDLSRHQREGSLRDPDYPNTAE